MLAGCRDPAGLTAVGGPGWPAWEAPAPGPRWPPAGSRPRRPARAGSGRRPRRSHCQMPRFFHRTRGQREVTGRRLTRPDPRGGRAARGAAQGPPGLPAPSRAPRQGRGRRATAGGARHRPHRAQGGRTLGTGARRGSAWPRRRGRRGLARHGAGGPRWPLPSRRVFHTVTAPRPRRPAVTGTRAPGSGHLLGGTRVQGPERLAAERAGARPPPAPADRPAASAPRGEAPALRRGPGR